MARLSQAQKKRRRKQARKRAADFIVSHNGHVEIVSDMSDNPFAYGAGNTHQKEKVLKNRRTSPIIQYRHTKYKNERGEWIPHIKEYQKEAGLKFEELYYRSKATPSAQDFTKEPVDGGGGGDVFQDVTIDAIKELIKAHDAIGLNGYQLLEQVCGHHVFIGQMARNLVESRVLMESLREALDAAALHWGYLKPRTNYP